MNKNLKKKVINFFSIDIEGMDYDVIEDINLKKFEIKNFSFEHLHLNIYQNPSFRPLKSINAD